MEGRKVAGGTQTQRRRLHIDSSALRSFLYKFTADQSLNLWQQMSLPSLFRAVYHLSHHLFVLLGLSPVYCVPYTAESNRSTRGGECTGLVAWYRLVFSPPTDTTSERVWELLGPFWGASLYTNQVTWDKTCRSNDLCRLYGFMGFYSNIHSLSLL